MQLKEGDNISQYELGCVKSPYYKRCKLSTCPYCEGSRVSELRERDKNIFANLIGSSPEYNFYFLTLSLGNSSDVSLKFNLDEMENVWRYILSQRWLREEIKKHNISFAKYLHVKEKENNFFNSHYHIIVISRNDTEDIINRIINYWCSKTFANIHGQSFSKLKEKVDIFRTLTYCITSYSSVAVPVSVTRWQKRATYSGLIKEFVKLYKGAKGFEILIN